jgi:hypothetical protein
MAKKPKPAAINEFTFYGDLVGISSLYAATPKGAYNALNDYYNIVFHGLDAYYHGLMSSPKPQVWNERSKAVDS